jgi:hypothetical protein
MFMPEQQEKVFNWSPDGGRFVFCEGKTYWSDGDVTDGLPLRMMPFGGEHNEDYSAWSDEYRAKVRAEHQAIYAERRRIEAERIKRRDLLVESAKSKLTEDEIDALAEYYRD